jgi:A/G-specific adenine glycosylase
VPHSPADPVTALSQWFAREARDLPWRRTRDPYAIWISEVMLQQTQVATVIPYYHRFLERFPTIQALAQAPEPEVLRLWSGLGYYSRARNLRRAARFLEENFRGAFPRDREAMLGIPGIGPYTAGAVLSIAFDLAVPLVDGNVQRVFARFYALRDTVESGAAKAFFWDRAHEWVAAARSPRALNQALMELGATVCIKGAPRCRDCPLATGCEARRLGLEQELPRRNPRRAPVELWWLALVLQNRGRYLLRRNPAGTWWADLWDFPHADLPSARAAAGEAARWAQTYAAPAPPRLLPTQKHTVTHHRLRVVPCVLAIGSRHGLEDWGEIRWVRAAEATQVPLSSLARKVLAAVAENSTAATLMLQ